MSCNLQVGVERGGGRRGEGRGEEGEQFVHTLLVVTGSE